MAGISWGIHNYLSLPIPTMDSHLPMIPYCKSLPLKRLVINLTLVGFIPTGELRATNYGVRSWSLSMVIVSSLPLPIYDQGVCREIPMVFAPKRQLNKKEFGGSPGSENHYIHHD
jgi:hypothetical protein